MRALSSQSPGGRRGITRRAALGLLAAGGAVVMAARGAWRWAAARRSVQVGGARGPVIPVVPLDVEGIGPGDQLAG